MVILLLAGCLEDPHLLIETLLNERDDAFHTQLLLAGRCLAETRVGSVDHKLHKNITTKLLTLLYSASERDRNQASIVIGLLGNSMLSELSALLEKKDKKDYIRAAFVRTLGHIGNSVVSDNLLTILRDASESWKVRAAAARALGQIGDHRAIEDLVKATKDKYINVRIASLEALAQIGDPNAVDGLLARVLDPEEERLVQEAASKALKQLGRPAEDRLLEMLQHRRRGDPHVIYCLFMELINFGSTRVVEFLTGILYSRSEGASSRCYAVDGLSRICGARVLEKLIDILYDPDEDNDLKLAIIRALGTVGGRRAAQVLTSLLQQNSNRFVRKEIARALRIIGDPHATEGILLALHDKSFEVRLEVMALLENVSDQRVIDILLQVALNDKHENLRQTAIWTLERQKNSQLVDFWLEALSNKQDKMYGKRWAASKALGKIGDGRQQVMEKLTTILLDKSDNPYIRINVAESLAEIGDPIAIENLLIVLTSKDEYLPLRQKAAEVIEKLMQACDPVSFCELVFKYWTPGRQVRGCSSVLYSFLVRIAPRLRETVGKDWLKWRHRLMPYTTWMLKMK